MISFQMFFWTISYTGIFYTVLVLIWRKNLEEKVNIYNQQLNIWWNKWRINWRLHNWQSRRTGLMDSKYVPIKPLPLLTHIPIASYAHAICNLVLTLFPMGGGWFNPLIVYHVTTPVLNRVKTYPPAHDPDAAPPFSVHSAAVKQVPFRKVFPDWLLKKLKKKSC